MKLFEFDEHIGDWRVLVQTRDVQKGAVTTRCLADDAVTNAKIADGAITNEKIVDNTIEGRKFADNSIDNDKVIDGTLSGGKFIDDSIDGSKIKDNTVPGSKLADGSIESVDIKDNTLEGSKLVDNSIDGSKIKDNQIEGRHLIDNSIPGSKIKDGTIENVDIKDNTLDGAKIIDNTVDGAKIANGAINADKLVNNSVTAAKIEDYNPESAEPTGVTTAKIADGAVGTSKIEDYNPESAEPTGVTTQKLADWSVTEAKLANGAVTTAKLADGLISEIENITDAAPTAGSVKPVQSGGVKEQIDVVDDKIEGTKNYVEGFYLNASGEPIADSNQCYSDFIAIDPSALTYGIAVKYGTYKSTAMMVFYDANKDFANYKGEISGTTQRTLTQSSIQGYSYVRISFEKGYTDASVIDQRTLIPLWVPSKSGGIKDTLAELSEDVEDNSEKIEENSGKIEDVHIEVGTLRADVYSEEVSFDVVSGVSIPIRKYFIDCNTNQGETYVIKAEGPFTEVACYGITKEDEGVSIGSFLTTNSLTFTSEDDFVRLTFTIIRDSITGDGTGKLGISAKDNVNERISALEQYKKDKETVFYGEKRATTSFFDTVVEFHAKAGDRVSFIVRANASTFKGKSSGAATGINSLTGIYLKGGDVDYVKFTSGVNGKINLWHTCIAPNDLDTLSIYCNKNNDIVDGLSPLLSVEVRVGYDNLPIPDYYFNDNYLQDKIKRIGEIVQNISGDAFVFTTDEHWEFNRRYTPEIIKYISEKSFYSKHVSTGDHVQVICRGVTISGGEEDDLNPYVHDFINQYTKAGGKPFLSAIGNHEYLTENYTAGRLDGVDLHNWVRNSHLMENVGIVYGSRDKLYYYHDDTERLIRYIFLSSFTPNENAARTNTAAIVDYDSTQLDWLTNTAMNVENGWSIIVVTHNILRYIYNVPDHPDISYIDAAKPFLSALLAANNNGKIVAVLNGHAHRDGVSLVTDADVNANTGNSLFVVTTTCDANGFDWDSERLTDIRPNGTTKEIAFDFVCFDKGKKMLDFVRFGAPASLDFHRQGTIEERVVRYNGTQVAVGNSATLVPVTGGTITWSSSNTSVATVSNGVVSGIASGSCVITAINELNQAELFNVNVAQS